MSNIVLSKNPFKIGDKIVPIPTYHGESDHKTEALHRLLIVRGLKYIVVDSTGEYIVSFKIGKEKFHLCYDRFIPYER